MAGGKESTNGFIPPQLKTSFTTDGADGGATKSLRTKSYSE
jgi:hypothetical protein